MSRRAWPACRVCAGTDFTVQIGHNQHGVRRLYRECVRCARDRRRRRMRTYRAAHPAYRAREAELAKRRRSRAIGSVVA